MNLARESFYTLLFHITGFVCSTIAGIIIARTLGPSNKGIIAVTLLYPSLFLTIFGLTAGLTIMHHMGKREYDIKTFAGSALIILAIVSVIVILIFFGSIGLFRETLYKGIELRYLMLAGFAIPFYLMLYYFSSILQGGMDIKGYNISNQLLSYSNLFFVLGFIVLWRFTVLEAVVAGISGILFGALYSFLKVIKKAGKLSFSRELTGSIIKDGAKIQIGSIAAFLYTQANLFILNYYATSAEVGFYSVAFSLTNILLFFSVSLEIGLYPKVAHATMEEAVELVKVATRQILLITASGALVMAVFSKLIILIYGGSAFLPSVSPLLILLPGIVIFVIAKILSTLWIRKGWFFPLTIIATGTAVLSIVLNLLLAPKFGANGAAIATTATYIFLGLTSLLLFRKFVSNDLYRLLIPSRTDMIMYLDIAKSFVGILQKDDNKAI